MERSWMRTVGRIGACAALLALVACQPGMKTAPGQAPAAPQGTEREAGLPAGSVPAGIYFLHELEPELGGCVLVGERTTGVREPAGSREAEQARSRAVLDMAEQARWLGGNVVALPSFRADFQSGQLQGRVFRCDDTRRRDLYERASAAGALTVVAP